MSVVLRRRTVNRQSRRDGEPETEIIPLGSPHGRSLSASSSLLGSVTTAATTATRDSTSTLKPLRSYSRSSLPTDRIPASAFKATTSLQIQADGKDRCGLPLPPSQLAIPIFDPTTARLAYTSIRATRRSGSCRLVRAGAGDVTTARTTYRWGPGRDPVVRIGGDSDTDADEFQVVAAGLLTRAVAFSSRRWGRFEWRYGDRHERGGWVASSLLVLEKIVSGDRGSGGEQRIKVAQLVRDKAYRTPETGPWTAGNGGRLQMALCGEDGNVPLVDEVLVVVTCLVMLKKEIDRLRTMQIMAMSGGAS